MSIKTKQDTHRMAKEIVIIVKSWISPTTVYRLCSHQQFYFSFDLSLTSVAFSFAVNLVDSATVV